MDETPIKAGRMKKGKMNLAYIWPIYGEQDEICFTFSKSRGMLHILDQLGAYDGTLATCKLHDVNPCEYLVDVLQRVCTHPASRVEESTPRVWKDCFADSPLCSDLETLTHDR
jgi:hypothetical protein